MRLLNCLLLIFFCVPSFSKTNMDKVLLQKRDYQYRSVVPYGGLFEHYCSEEYDLYLYKYHDGAVFYIIEGSPEYALTGERYNKDLSDSIYYNRYLLLEEQQYNNLKKRTRKNSNIFNNKNNVLEYAGVDNSKYWRLLMSENVSAGYIGVENQKYFDRAIEGLQRKNIKGNGPMHFYMLEKYENADVKKDLPSVDSLNNCKQEEFLDILKPIGGRNSVYIFLCQEYVFLQEEVKDSVKVFLSVNVDSQSYIVNSQLCLLDVVGIGGFKKYILKSNKRIKFKNEMRLKDLEFVCPEEDKYLYKEIINNGVTQIRHCR